VGDNSTRTAVELSKEAEKSGADGVLAFYPIIQISKTYPGGLI